jgi:peptidoglycan DL-endopeptidase CwlO
MRQKVIYLLFVILSIAIVAGCSSSIRFSTKEKTGYSPNTNSDNTYPFTNNIISEAWKWIGTPYCYGGESHSCVDCSGYVQQVFLSAGINIPRTAARQYTYALRVNEAELQPGDLVFFKNKNNINHVGIYIGKNGFLHASSSNGVEKQSLSNRYYQSRLAGFGRFTE